MSSKSSTAWPTWNSKSRSWRKRAAKSDGTEKEALDLEIKALHAQHERAEEALAELKGAELDDWAVHEQNVRMAMQDLDSRLSNIR